MRAKAIPKILFAFLFLLSLVLMFAEYLQNETREIARDNRLPYPAIMAHRGLSYYVPETTLPAYLASMEISPHIYLEADVQRTKDGVLICFHDETPEEKTNIKEVYPERASRPVGTFTYEELQQLDAGSWFNEKYPERARESYRNLKILSLKELVTLAKSKPVLGLYLETKHADKYPGIEKEILLLLLEAGWISGNDLHHQATDIAISGAPSLPETSHPRVIFQSFVEESIETFFALAPKIPRVFLVDEETIRRHGGFAGVIQFAKKYDAHIGLSGRLAFPWYHYVAVREKRIIHHYTINELYQMKILQFLGSGGFFTDKPDIALKYFYPEQYRELNVNKILDRLGY